ncbi:hypothetical protein B834_1660 [Enterococcus mundtii 1A]|nr:hypothetical protein [Enterococcus mundtii 1A]
MDGALFFEEIPSVPVVYSILGERTNVPNMSHLFLGFVSNITVLIP